MKRVIIAVALAALAGVLALAQTEQTARGQQRQSDKKSPSGPRLDTGSQSRWDAASGFHNPLPKEVKQRMNASLVQTNEATKNARQLLSAGKLTQAEAECRRALSLSPKVNGKVWNTDALRVLGEVYIRQGRNQEALQSLLGCYHNTRSVVLDLGVALAYCRMGNLPMARRFYSDQAVLQYVRDDQRDEYHRSMPGVTNLRALEASILFARGNESAMSGRHAEAAAEFEAAGKLAPTNGLIAYCAGMSLVHLNRPAEAAPYFRRAAQYGHGKIAQQARSRIAGSK